MNKFNVIKSVSIAWLHFFRDVHATLCPYFVQIWSILFKVYFTCSYLVPLFFRGVYVVPILWKYDPFYLLNTWKVIKFFFMFMPCSSAWSYIRDISLSQTTMPYPWLHRKFSIHTLILVFKKYHFNKINKLVIGH